MNFPGQNELGKILRLAAHGVNGAEAPLSYSSCSNWDMTVISLDFSSDGDADGDGYNVQRFVELASFYPGVL